MQYRDGLFLPLPGAEPANADRARACSHKQSSDHERACTDMNELQIDDLSRKCDSAEAAKRFSPAIDAFRGCALGTILIRREGDRLYNMESKTNVSLSDVADMLVDGLRIIVEDAATGENVTSEILDKLSDNAHSGKAATQSDR